MQITFYGHSCLKLKVNNKVIYFDPYLKFVHKLNELEKPDLIVFSHGHFDHGALMLKELFKYWHCPILAPQNLIKWMKRKYKKIIPIDLFNSIDHNQSITINGLNIKAIPAHHPINRLGKTIFALHTRSRSPGAPVNGYWIEGFYFSGDTKYSEKIIESLSQLKTKICALPIGGKYGIANPQEALQIATEIQSPCLIPVHYHPLINEVPFRYQPSSLERLIQKSQSEIKAIPLAIGEMFELS